MLENIAYAKNNLPRLIHQVQDAEPVVLTRQGKPVAVLQSYEQYQAQQSVQFQKPNWFSETMKWRADNKDLIGEIDFTDEQIDSWRSREMPIAPDWAK